MSAMSDDEIAFRAAINVYGATASRATVCRRVWRGRLMPTVSYLLLLCQIPADDFRLAAGLRIQHAVLPVHLREVERQTLLRRIGYRAFARYDVERQKGHSR
jgi:hypothetical protein